METQFHIAAYRGSVGAGLSNVDIAAVQDGQLTISNSHFVLPRQAQIMWAFGLGTGLDRLRLNTPKMRYVGLPSLIPVNSGTTVASPANYVDLINDNIILDPVDETAVEASSTDAGAQTMTAIVAFGFGVRPTQARQTYRLRATCAITGVTGAWAQGSMTLDQSLPAGSYDIVGMDAWGTNLIAARLLFSGYAFRPGCIARNTAVAIQSPMFTDGRLGIYGSFQSINLPTIEIFCNGACTAQTVYLDLVKTGGSINGM